jgi:hypothetical protein
MDPSRSDRIHGTGQRALVRRPGDNRLVATSKLHLYYGTVKSAAGGRHIMAWATSREHALDLVEAALTAPDAVQGSVVGPLMSLPADVMKPGVYVEAKSV